MAAKLKFIYGLNTFKVMLLFGNTKEIKELVRHLKKETDIIQQRKLVLCGTVVAQKIKKYKKFIFCGFNLYTDLVIHKANMPSTRLTLIKNAQQKTRAAILFKSDAKDPIASILTVAKNKLRIKNPERIFIEGGDEISTADEFAKVLQNDR